MNNSQPFHLPVEKNFVSKGPSSGFLYCIIFYDKPLPGDYQEKKCNIEITLKLQKLSKNDYFCSFKVSPGKYHLQNS